MRQGIVIPIAGLALLSGAWGAEPDKAWRSGTSPRIEMLKKQVTSGSSGAVSQFWLETKAHGTPLVEVIPSDSSHVLLTFLYKAHGPTTSVGLLSMLAVATESSQHELTLLDTGVWYKTYWIRNDMRFSYSLAPNTTGFADTSGGSPQRDALNPRSSPAGTNIGDSIVELPATPPQPWIVPRPDVARGKLVEEHIVSKILKSERRA